MPQCLNADGRQAVLGFMLCDPCLRGLNAQHPDRQRYEAETATAVRWSAPATIDQQMSAAAPTAFQSISSICEASKLTFHPYSMQGAQKAETQVICDGKRLDFSTTLNMHSEMVAVSHMLEQRKWSLYLGQIIWTDTFLPVAANQFTTTQPHCGFCSVMLIVLNLPLSKATHGNNNLAVNLEYPLPKEVAESPHVLARLLDCNTYCGFNEIKKIINAMVNCRPDGWVLNLNGLALVNEQSYVAEQQGILKLSWQELVSHKNGETLKRIWKVIFRALYKLNEQSK